MDSNDVVLSGKDGIHAGARTGDRLKREVDLDLASTDCNLLNVLHDEVPISYIFFGL
jgi:hypothetical protein